MKPRVRRDFNVLRDEEDKRQELTQKLEENLCSLTSTDVDILNEEITNTVRECAEAVCPPLDEEEKKEPWEDECLMQMIRDMKKCKDRKRVKSYQKQIKDRRKYLKNAYFKEIADNINTVAEARQVDKEFALAKKYSALRVGERTTVSNHKF